MEGTNYQSDTTQEQSYIDVRELFKRVWERRKVFYWVLPITFVLSSALILCVPRYYACEVILAPEAQSASPSGSLQALASSFGFNMQNMANTDALYPMIYPDMVSSPNFLVTLFDIDVTTAEGEFKGTYYQYLLQMYKKPFWTRWKGKIKKWLTPEEPKVTSIGKKEGKRVDVFNMSEAQWYALDLMRKNISCKVDKKTDVITFRVKAQDKLVCALMADSVCGALQMAVTEYRTKKARVDIDYYAEVMEESLRDYQEASETYIRYADSHSGMNLQQYKIEAKNLETEMEIKQAAYTSFQKQHLASQARLQENTPVFTVMQSASIPLKPAGPKRMLFVLAMLILASFITGFVVCKDLILDPFKEQEKNA